MIHKLKIKQSFADAILSEKKNFEVRENDRGFQAGDFIVFTVLYESDGCEILNHPLSKRLYEITYVLSGWGIKENYVVFGIRRVEMKDA